MIALRVRIDSEKPITVGADDLGVLNASVSSLGRLGAAAHLGESHIFDCRLDGLTPRPSGVDNEYLNWLKR